MSPRVALAARPGTRPPNPSPRPRANPRADRRGTRSPSPSPRPGATPRVDRRAGARDFSRGATGPWGGIVGATMRAHCCDVMRTHVQATAEPAALVAADRAVLYDVVFDEYSLAGTGAQCGDVLAYCPWCGAQTPPSKRDLWFAELGPPGPRSRRPRARRVLPNRRLVAGATGGHARPLTETITGLVW
ncbi:MAG TPA: hypothetical protein VFZ79_15430 [Acidimicrobiales bacterium]